MTGLVWWGPARLNNLKGFERLRRSSISLECIKVTDEQIVLNKTEICYLVLNKNEAAKEELFHSSSTT